MIETVTDTSQEMPCKEEVRYQGVFFFKAFQAFRRKKSGRRSLKHDAYTYIA